jgi:hypothetical protein
MSEEPIFNNRDAVRLGCPGYTHTRWACYCDIVLLQNLLRLQIESHLTIKSKPTISITTTGISLEAGSLVRVSSLH